MSRATAVSHPQPSCWPSPALFESACPLPVSLPAVGQRSACPARLPRDPAAATLPCPAPRALLCPGAQPAPRPPPAHPRSCQQVVAGMNYKIGFGLECNDGELPWAALLPCTHPPAPPAPGLEGVPQRGQCTAPRSNSCFLLEKMLGSCGTAVLLLAAASIIGHKASSRPL